MLLGPLKITPALKLVLGMSIMGKILMRPALKIQTRYLLNHNFFLLELIKKPSRTAVIQKYMMDLGSAYLKITCKSHPPLFISQ